MLDLPLDFKALADAGSMVGSGADSGLRGGPLHVGHGHQFHAFLSQRIVRQVRSLPSRLAKVSGHVGSLVARGIQAPDDLAVIDELFKAMRLTSICGLGQIIHAPLASVIKHFPKTIEAHLNERRCPAGVCFRGRN